MFELILTGLLAFVVAHYTLTVAEIKQTIAIAVSVIFAALVLVFAGALTLAELAL